LAFHSFEFFPPFFARQTRKKLFETFPFRSPSFSFFLFFSVLLLFSIGTTGCSLLMRAEGSTKPPHLPVFLFMFSLSFPSSWLLAFFPEAVFPLSMAFRAVVEELFDLEKSRDVRKNFTAVPIRLSTLRFHFRVYPVRSIQRHAFGKQHCPIQSLRPLPSASHREALKFCLCPLILHPSS